MSEVRIFRVPNKLREKILKSGGPRALEILAKAEENLAEMRPPCLEIIDELIAEIVGGYGRGRRKGDEDFLRLYTMSAQIIDCAAPVAELEIDKAAFFLCELVDRCGARDQWDWPAVDVHIDALQLLRLDLSSLPPEARQKIFLGLKQINDKFKAREAAEQAAEPAPLAAIGMADG